MDDNNGTKWAIWRRAHQFNSITLARIWRRVLILLENFFFQFKLPSVTIGESNYIPEEIKHNERKNVKKRKKRLVIKSTTRKFNVCRALPRKPLSIHTHNNNNSVRILILWYLCTGAPFDLCCPFLALCWAVILNDANGSINCAGRRFRG